MKGRKRNGTVGLYEAKTHFSELVDRVEKGEVITITRHGTPIAKLVPVTRDLTTEERQAAIRHWLEVSKGITLGGLKLRDLIEEGRP